MNKTLDDMPELLTASDLVELGLFASRDSAYKARQRGNGPTSIKLKSLVVYQKKDVIKWIESRKRKANRRWSNSTIDGVRR